MQYRTRDQTQVERRSACSASHLVIDYNNKLTDEEQFNQQPMSIKKMRDDSQIIKKTSEFSLPQVVFDMIIMRLHIKIFYFLLCLETEHCE